MGGSGGLERTDFKQCLIWVHVAFLKELILTVSTLAGMVVLKEKIFKSLYFGWVWWLGGTEFLTVFTLTGCGGLERTDFLQFLLWVCLVVLKKLIFNSFYFGRVWWSLKELSFNSFHFDRVWCM